VAFELTTDQARSIARLRRTFPASDLRTHQRAWGVIVEVCNSGRTVALAAYDGHGGSHRDHPVQQPAA